MATTIYATNDGRIINFETTNWTDTRDATSGNTVSTGGSIVDGLQISKASGRGGTTYGCARSFFQFDTSGITHVPKSASFNVFGYSTNAVTGLYGVKSTQSNSLAIADFDNIEGWQTGGVDNGGNITKYTENLSSWSTSGYNTFTLTQTALVNIASLSSFKIAILDNSYDIRGSEPSTANLRSGFHSSAYSGTTRDPKLIITEQENAVFFGANF